MSLSNRRTVMRLASATVGIALVVSATGPAR